MNRNDLKLIVVSSLGGLFEFYDFTVFLIFAKIISELFFSSSEYLSLMAALTVFAAGYLFRPLGGIVMSHFGDKYGRKKTFVFSILVMTSATFLIGLLPTYKQAGIIAPFLLLFLRICQGFSIGGELPACITYVYEHMDSLNIKKGIAVIFSGVVGGCLVGSVLGSILTGFLTSEQMNIWGWRIPFFIGGIFGLIGLYIRLYMSETPAFVSMRDEGRLAKFPLKYMLEKYSLSAVKGFLLCIIPSVVGTAFYIYFPVYLSSICGYSVYESFTISLIGQLMFCVIVILWGFIGDSFNIKSTKIFGISSVFIVVLILPFLFVIKTKIFLLVLLFYLLITIAESGCNASFSILLADLFPDKIRFTGIALSYNICFAVFGGITPLLSTFLCNIFHSNIAIVCLIIPAAFLGYAALFMKSKGIKTNENDI